MYALTIYVPKEPWNKNKLIGQKLPLKLQQIWSIRIRLELPNKTRDLALFNLAIDSKLRGCDLVALLVRDVCHGNIIQSRAIVVQKKTQQPVQFEITENTRKSISELIATQNLSPQPVGSGSLKRIICHQVYQLSCLDRFGREAVVHIRPLMAEVNPT
ncbi:hypothetical protein [Paraglaciecola sp.]|uniref:hypothetical protein n=1 Tax=Paraglaciecola sp. TaxID=1920173 RepID=UPI003EF88FA6